LKTITCFDTKEVCKTYQEYLQSKHWKNKKKEYYNKNKRKCTKCGSEKDLHLHHKTYQRVGNELLKDLTCLCANCHSEEHKRLNANKKSKVKKNPKKIKRNKQNNKRKKKKKRPHYKKPVYQKKLEDLEKYKL